MVVTFNNKDKFMKTKFLFLTALLALTPTLCTVSYGQNLLGTAVKSILGIANKNKAKTTDKTYITEDYKTQENKKNEENNTTNANDEIALIVSGKAIDSEKATSIALRSAIEQAYGTFVSANTTILNDDLVKDEIVTISNGNIKSYKVLSEAKCEDGQIMVTVDATVCISKLVSYAKSKGASTEFAGATFAQSMKIKELNKKNELQALQNVLVMAKELLPIAFDKKLYVADPCIAKAIPQYSNPRSNLEKEYYYYGNLTDGYYQMKMYVIMEPNDNTDKVMSSILETLDAISLSTEEIEEYRKVGITTSSIGIFMPSYDASSNFTFRNSKEETNKWLLELANIFASEFSNFKIVDNLGETSTFKGPLMAKDQCTHQWYDIGTVSDDERLERYGIMHESQSFYFTQGTGIFKDGICVNLQLPEYEKSPRLHLYAPTKGFFELPGEMEMKNDYAYWILNFRMSASEISKYSNFKLESNSK